MGIGSVQDCLSPPPPHPLRQYILTPPPNFVSGDKTLQRTRHTLQHQNREGNMQGKHRRGREAATKVSPHRCRVEKQGMTAPDIHHERLSTRGNTVQRVWFILWTVLELVVCLADVGDKVGCCRGCIPRKSVHTRCEGRCRVEAIDDILNEIYTTAKQMTSVKVAAAYERHSMPPPMIINRRRSKSMVLV